jgi:hypothetical protein
MYVCMYVCMCVSVVGLTVCVACLSCLIVLKCHFYFILFLGVVWVGPGFVLVLVLFWVWFVSFGFGCGSSHLIPLHVFGHIHTSVNSHPERYPQHVICDMIQMCVCLGRSELNTYGEGHTFC